MTALLDLREHLPITNPTWIFFLVLCIILFAPVLLNKLKIPHLIGMILAGILIGEHGFDILARDSSFELFGQVGLYYIMFLAGLEMNMEDFPAIRGKAIVFGILAFIIPIVLGFFSNILILKYGLSLPSCWRVCTPRTHSFPIPSLPDTESPGTDASA